MRAALAIALVVSCGCAQSPEYTYKVVHAYPHDPTAFTQGLEYHDGFLYEGTGREGHSTLRRVARETGKVLQRIDLPPNYFGEGITVINGRVVQLTYKSQAGFVYDRANFRLLRDRKSTRLNSSHLVISYAVFCLK